MGADPSESNIAVARHHAAQSGLSIDYRNVTAEALATAGETFDVTVASFRDVKWDSFRPNFFVVFAPGVLDGTAGTYMTSAFLQPSAGAMAKAPIKPGARARTSS